MQEYIKFNQPKKNTNWNCSYWNRNISNNARVLASFTESLGAVNAGYLPDDARSHVSHMSHFSQVSAKHVKSSSRSLADGQSQRSFSEFSGSKYIGSTSMSNLSRPGKLFFFDSIFSAPLRFIFRRLRKADLRSSFIYLFFYSWLRTVRVSSIGRPSQENTSDF